MSLVHKPLARIPLALLIALMGLMGLADGANAQVRFRDQVACRTPQGKSPDILLSRVLSTRALRSTSRDLLIVLNRRQIRRYGDFSAMALMFYFHECAHFYHPMVFRRVSIAVQRRKELYADCLGLKLMARKGLLSVSRWRHIQRGYPRLKGGPNKRHPSGAVRLAHLRRCALQIRHLIRPDHRVRRITSW